MFGAEITGRAYGGGMLKLEPREAGMLAVPSACVGGLVRRRSSDRRPLCGKASGAARLRWRDLAGGRRAHSSGLPAGGELRADEIKCDAHAPAGKTSLSSEDWGNGFLSEVRRRYRGHWRRKGTSSVRRPVGAMPASHFWKYLLEKLLTVAVRDGSSARIRSWLRLWTCGWPKSCALASMRNRCGLARAAAGLQILRCCTFHRLTGCANGGKCCECFLALPAPTPACSGRPIASRSMWGYPLG